MLTDFVLPLQAFTPFLMYLTTPNVPARSHTLPFCPARRAGTSARKFMQRSHSAPSGNSRKQPRRLCRLKLYHHVCNQLTHSATYLSTRTPTFSLESLSSRFAVLDARLHVVARDSPAEEAHSCLRQSESYLQHKHGVSAGRQTLRPQARAVLDHHVYFLHCVYGDGVGMDASGRYTSALPVVVRLYLGLTKRIDSLRTAREQYPYHTSSNSLRLPPRRRVLWLGFAVVSDGCARRAGHWCEWSADAGGGGDVVDRFVLAKSGTSSLSLPAVPSPLALREGAGVGSADAGVEYAYPIPTPTIDRTRERENGMPIGVGGRGGMGM
ncbi:hypothetical protein B0H19DRAFT_1254011 [Mycena capillaripes]|nr:hypothetical protein B0H19DRAFT_1254011 [Mycena capillaripes]